MIIYMMMSMSEPDLESKERTSRLFETAEVSVVKLHINIELTPY